MKCSLIEHSEASRLRFFSLVEHARRYGSKNRPGLLRALLTKKRWYITQDDEELARQRLKRLEVGQEGGKEPRREDGEGVKFRPRPNPGPGKAGGDRCRLWRDDVAPAP